MVSEEEKEKKVYEKLLEEIIAEKFSNIRKKLTIQLQEDQESHTR